MGAPLKLGNNRRMHVLSYGGGVNSTALMVSLIEGSVPLDGVVFADTGGELPETYRYLGFVSSYLEDHKIPFKILSKNESLYDRCKRRRVIPSELWRWCTRDFKILPIYAYYRTLRSHVNQYLGIAYEERDRMRESGVTYVSNKYPLVKQNLDRLHCLDLIQMVGLRVPSRSGCFFCPFNSISRWAEIYKDHRNLYAKATELEETSKHYPKQRLMRLTLRALRDRFDKDDPLPQIQVRRRCGSECLI